MALFTRSDPLHPVLQILRHDLAKDRPGQEREQENARYSSIWVTRKSLGMSLEKQTASHTYVQLKCCAFSEAGKGL